MIKVTAETPTTSAEQSARAETPAPAETSAKAGAPVTSVIEGFAATVEMTESVGTPAEYGR